MELNFKSMIAFLAQVAIGVLAFIYRQELSLLLIEMSNT